MLRDWSLKPGEQYGGREWSETGQRGWLSDGVSTVDSSWWAIITYKVIKDIGRQREKGVGARSPDAGTEDGGRRWAEGVGCTAAGRQGQGQGRRGNGQFRECDIYIVIKSREQVGPLGKILVLEQLQTH